MYTKAINGHEIAFADVGSSHDSPAIVTFSGWKQDHRGWASITPYLMLKHPVVRVCFRAYGPNRDGLDDVTFTDYARDVLALLDNVYLSTGSSASLNHTVRGQPGKYLRW